MLLLDVNVLVYAMREDDDRHVRCLTWLTGALGGAETVGIPELAVAGVLRIATNHRIFVQPSRPADVFDFVHDVLATPAAMLVRAGDRHLAAFERIVRDGNVKGSDVTDAYFAALALENGATFVTHDRGFGRFPGIRLLDPLA